MKEKLGALLKNRRKKYLADPTRIPAGVLIPLYLKEGEYHILFTRRTENVMTHKGQISFPGGSYEEGDGSLACTALRESREEIGLREEDVELIGELDDSPSVTSNYLITPFVGFFPWPYRFRLNPWEVAEIIEVPVRALLDEKNTIRESKEGRLVYSYDYRGNIIWGATARILGELLPLIAAACEESAE